MYTYICTYSMHMYIYIYIYMFTYLHLRLHLHTYVCISMYVTVCLRSCLNAQAAQTLSPST